MEYFDIAEKEADKKLASRLGFSGIFSFGKEIELTSKIVQNKKQILCSRDMGTLMKATRDANVIGIAFEDNEIIGKVIAAAKDIEKPIVVSLSGIFSTHVGERYRNTGRIKGLLKEIALAKADLILISGARNENYLLSASQMIEIAKFLGVDEQKAKKALSRLGDLIDS